MKCSVLVANYNSENFIEDFFFSILGQTYENWEILIVDDCSTDNSPERIKRFLSDERVKLFQNENNRGVGFTKKKAAELASGEVLMFVDPDDALMPEALTLMVEQHIKFKEASLVYSTFFNCDENLRKIGVAGWVGEIQKPYTNLHKDKISHLCSFKRDSYYKTSGINAALKAAVDKDLYYKLEEVGNIIFINKPLYLYRKNKSGVSQSLNSIKASEYGLLVLEDAYQRRLLSGFTNIDKKIIKQKYSIHFHEKALNQSIHGNSFLAYKSLIKASCYSAFYKPLEKIKIGCGFYLIKSKIFGCYKNY